MNRLIHAAIPVPVNTGETVKLTIGGTNIEAVCVYCQAMPQTDEGAGARYQVQLKLPDGDALHLLEQAARQTDEGVIIGYASGERHTRPYQPRNQKPL